MFCGALVKPGGGNMQCLLLANSGLLFTPIVSQAVLAEFVSKAVVTGLGSSRRKYTPEEVDEFLCALGPLLDIAVPVGLRAIYPAALQTPSVPVRGLLQRLVARWPVGVERAALQVAVASVDPKDLHLAVAALEHAADVVVTSNVADLAFLSDVCSIEPPGQFLARFI